MCVYSQYVCVPGALCVCVQLCIYLHVTITATVLRNGGVCMYMSSILCLLFSLYTVTGTV